MESKFKQIMSNNSDSELANILFIEKDRYQTEAVSEARKEFESRKLNVKDFFSEEEVKNSESLRKNESAKDFVKETLYYYKKLMIKSKSNILIRFFIFTIQLIVVIAIIRLIASIF